MTDFKVGDRVQINDKSITPNRIGQTGDVVRITDRIDHISVRFSDGAQIGFFAQSLTKLPRAIDRLTPGMSSVGLADAVEETIRQVRDRVTGVGDEQYATDKGQKFEGLKVSELIRMAREEAQDLVVYATMTDIRLARIEAAMTGAGL